MKKVFILFMADQWHSDRSKKFLAVSDSDHKLVKFATADASDREEPMEKRMQSILWEIHQTQGRETNYIIEEHEVL